MPVSQLQELCAKNGLKTPEYKLCRTEGNSHSPLFTIQVLLNGMSYLLHIFIYLLKVFQIIINIYV